MSDPHADRDAPRLPGLPLAIAVVPAVGRGATLLSSFDDALGLCGVHNYNLIPLSSVIPPGAKVAPVERYVAPAEEFGDRLYVVKADARCAEPGRVIAAGLGWYQWEDGRGVFVEHEVIGTDRAAVEATVDCQLRRALEDLCAVRGIPFDHREARRTLAVADVAELQSTVLVLAVYRSEGWG